MVGGLVSLRDFDIVSYWFGVPWRVSWFQVGLFVDPVCYKAEQSSALNIAAKASTQHWVVGTICAKKHLSVLFGNDRWVLLHIDGIWVTFLDMAAEWNWGWSLNLKMAVCPDGINTGNPKRGGGNTLSVSPDYSVHSRTIFPLPSLRSSFLLSSHFPLSPSTERRSEADAAPPTLNTCFRIYFI